MNISVLIPTLNEEKNISYALDSVKWADEVFIIDYLSTDKTLEIAEKYSNVRCFQHKPESYSKDKNWALSNLPFSYNWILILDADERITPELQKEIIEAVSKENSINGYYINRRFIFLNKWIRYCGWYPSWNLRLFRKGKARYEDRSVNEHMIVDGNTGYLKNDMIHENFKSLKEWIYKHNKYSSFEAEEFLKKQKTGLKASFFGSSVQKKRFIREKIFLKIPFRPFILFLYLYFLRLGFLDGRAGFIFCCLRAIQQFHIDIKIRELKNGKI